MSAPGFPSLVAAFAGEINFDNAATTPPFLSVLARLAEFAPRYSSIHRGSGKLSRAASGLFEEARLEILDFVGGNPAHDLLIHVKNTTEAVNRLSNRLAGHATRNVVLSTKMEHHSNDLPWRRNFEVHYAEVDGNGRLALDDLEKKLKKYGKRVRLVEEVDVLADFLLSSGRKCG
jgi:selenocysteine lyase/cysteine desulfurase